MKKLTLALSLLVLTGAAIVCWFYVTKISGPNYDIKTTPVVGMDVAAPVLPDIAGFTTAAVRAKIPAVSPGKVEIVHMESNNIFDYMSMNSLIDNFAEWQGEEEPFTIDLINGVFDLASLARSLNRPDLLFRSDEHWVLRAPIIIHPEATLVIRGAENNLKLIAERGVLISNFGKMFVVDATLRGWLEQRDEPSTYEDPATFRPYLVSWSNSLTYLASAEFSNLGYDFPKAYGISYTSSAPMIRKAPSTPRASGWIVDCTFKDIYYGFYSYEADDIVIVRNTYEDNIVYGIDPHDRSRGLIIAENKSYGAKKRHGIIVSREVDDSWIFNNHSHDNNGSGIMIDRNSRRNVIANNISENNGADGLVFFESPDNLSWNNRLLNNAKNGVRIRNSWNIVLRGDRIMNNGSYGLVAYTATLEEREDRETRDFELDPYTQRAGFDIRNVEMSGHAKSHIQTFNLESATFSDLRLFNAPMSFEGDLAGYDAELYDAATTADSVVTVYNLNRPAPVPLEENEDTESEAADGGSQNVKPAAGHGATPLAKTSPPEGVFNKANEDASSE